MTTNLHSRKGNKAPHLHPDQILARAKIVCETYAAEDATIESVCRASGVSYRSFIRWTNRLAEVAELYKKAREINAHLNPIRLKKIAKLALARKLEGYDDREEIQESKPDPEGGERIIPTKIVVKRKRVEPDTGIICFALKNVDPEHWRDSHEHDLMKDTKQKLFDYLAEAGRLATRQKGGANIKRNGVPTGNTVPATTAAASLMDL